MQDSGLSSPKEIAPGDNHTTSVLIVDDSAVIRSLITRAIDGGRDIKVIATASNGQMAVDLLKRKPVDVVILDIEMPVMDGLTAIPLLKTIDPGVQIVMASTLTQKNADISLKALELGATDYIPKPSSVSDAGTATTADFGRELAEKIKTLGLLARRKGVRRPAEEQKPPEPEKKKITLRTTPLSTPDVIAIGSSTGGPQALFQVIKIMGKDLRQPIVITQHMPATFTAILADHITRQCDVVCSEGKDGEILKPGCYYVAPGDFHMLFTKKPEGMVIKLTKDPPENFCRPALDPMLRSLVEIFGAKILAVILTGMGQDGCRGGEFVIKAGGGIIAQDEATSVVWGMPGAAALAGLCSSVLPVGEIGSAVRQIATKVSA